MKITHGKNVNDIYDRTDSYAGKKDKQKKHIQTHRYDHSKAEIVLT